MSSKPRHLILTSDERTWRFDRPALFLGEWCRLYDRKHVWSSMGAIVASPYGLCVSKKDQDEQTVRAFENRIAPPLFNLLNKFHGTSHGQRFWQMLIGHWMRTYLSTVYNRAKSLESCLKTYPVSSVTIASNPCYALAPADSTNAFFAADDNAWNQALYLKILAEFDRPEIHIEIVPDAEEIFSGRKVTSQAKLAAHNPARLARQLLLRAASLLARDTDAFIVNTYLPMRRELELHLALRQVPQLWRTKPLGPPREVDRELRKELGRQLQESITVNRRDPVNILMHSLVFDLLPICYLEGYQDLLKLASGLKWPKTPKFIFTSNNFDYDEVFKLWAATKAQTGTPYIAGQHGGNYGTRRIPLRTVEEETSDAFVTWGWRDGLPQHQPAFLLRTNGQSHPTPGSVPNGSLLVLTECLNYRVPVWDDTAEFSQRWTESMIFIDALRQDVRSILKLRLHSQFQNLTWHEIARLRDFDSTLSIDTGQTPLETLLRQAQLLIVTYNSSGFYEALSRNIPVIAFWINGVDSLRDSAKPYFEELSRVGIFHSTPQSAAQKVNEITGRVSQWWELKELQRARLNFCAQFAKTTDVPISELRDILLSAKAVENS